MGIFTSFKEAIFGKDEDDKAGAHPAARPAAGTRAAAPAGSATAPRPAAQATAARPAAPRPISEVDVEQRLDARPGADALNWRTSIVDLMKVVGLDPSYANRKELAQEMGRTDYEGSAEDNIWLHKRVMQEIAKAGGRVPAALRD
jgi:hypothetical protein